MRLSPQDIPKRSAAGAGSEPLDRLEGFRIQREFTADAARAADPAHHPAQPASTPWPTEGSRRRCMRYRGWRGSSAARYRPRTFSIDPRAATRDLCRGRGIHGAPGVGARQGYRAERHRDPGVGPRQWRCCHAHSEPGRERNQSFAAEDDRRDRAGGRGAVRVLDEGPGIKEDDAADLPALLAARPATRKRDRLSIVQRAEAHGATVSVENRPTGGAMFCLSFNRSAVARG